MKTITIFDTFGFFFRNYYALPRLTSSDGFPTGLLTGFMNFILQIEKEHETDYLLFALDSKGDSFRKALYPEYKANRQEAPEELLKQLPIAIEWIEQMGFQNISLDGFEADDVIASLSECAKGQQIRTRIVSHDKDLYQLIEDGQTTLYDPIKKTEIDSQRCVEKYAVTPAQFIDYQSLVGDSSDNVPGAAGIGPKTASQLLQTYGSLQGIYEHIDDIKPSWKQKLLDSEESVKISRELVTLRKDILPKCQLNKFVYPSDNPVEKIIPELQRYELNRVLSKINSTAASTTTPAKKTKSSSTLEHESVLLDSVEKLRDVLAQIPDKTVVAFDTETNSLDTKTADMVGFSFAWEADKGYYVPIRHNYLGVGAQVSENEAFDAIRSLIASHSIVGHNLKFDLALVYRLCNLDEIIPHADTMILAWQVDSQNPVGLDALMKRYVGHEMISFSQTVKKGDDFSSVPLEDACRYAAEDAVATLVLFGRLKEMLNLQSANHLLEESQQVEFPFINTLTNMERTGVKVDLEFFEQLLTRTDSQLSELTTRVHREAGEEFNLNSTQQLGRILFEKLGLPSSKKTKTGYSTNESVLEKLRDSHPIIDSILEYRELFKLKSTYIDPLLRYGKSDSAQRVYTSFLQTGTATGRLSSKNPNLQNIPVRTELGREIRRGFIAEEGHVLISIDYSQIELRLLAHFSRDSVLQEAFFHDKDIHRETAVKIFGEADAAEKRPIAKSINFGLIYGMGARKLSETLGIPNKEAKTYIDSYFNSFPTVKNYLNGIKELVRNQGYVETLLKRRRHFDFSNAAPYQQAGFEREACNTVFQGSAADLIKLSMNAIHEQLPTLPHSRMLLQVHDELIFETEESEAEKTAEAFGQLMEHIHPLEVPLKCGIAIGRNWAELK